MQSIISIIVPVYNVQDYLHKCIDSILCQSFVNFELLLIDDGSTDNSSKICDDYAQKDNRVKVIHKKNEGVTLARKIGVLNSIGEFICFVDSDDYLPLKSLDILYVNIGKSDIVVGSYDISYNTKTIHAYNKINAKGLGRIDYINVLLNRKIAVAPWGRLFRRYLFDDSIFNISSDIVVGEDFIMNINLAIKISSVTIIKNIVYTYVQRAFSVSYTFFPTLKYQKYFLSTLFDPIVKANLQHDCCDAIIHEKIFALGFAFPDKELSMQQEYVLQTINEAQKIQLRLKERIIILLLPLPAKIRTFIFNRLINLSKI